MTLPDLDDRLAFAFPTVDVGASGLDPFDDEDRAALVRLELPEAAESVDDPDPDDGLQAQTAEAVLTLRDGLAKLILLDAVEVWPTVLRLRSEGIADERIHELLFETAVDHLLAPASMGQESPDPARFVRALRALPDLPDDDELDDDRLDELEWMVEDWLDGDDHMEGEIAGVVRATIHDDLVAFIGDGFVALDDVVDRFAPVLRLDHEFAGEVLESYLTWWTSDLFLSPSGVAAADAGIIDHTRFRHVVTESEAADERLEVGIDLALLLDEVDVRTDGAGVWLAGAQAGDTVVVTRTADGIVVETATDSDVDTAPIVDAFVQARTTFADRMPIDVFWLYKATAIEARGFGPDLGRPLSELLAAAGWEAQGDELAPEGFDWEAAARERSEKGRLAVMAKAGVEGPQMVEPIESLVAQLFGDGWFDASAVAAPVADDQVGAVSSLLSRPGVAGSVFTLGLGPEPSEASMTSVLDLATSLLERAKTSDGSGPARLGLLAAAGLDRIDVVEDLLGRAHVNVVDDPVLCSIAGDLELDRGRLDVARRHYARGGIPLSNEVAGVLQGADAYVAGRNDPCPCGSGRKFKRCHGAPGGPPLTEIDRAELLIARLDRHDLRRSMFGIHRWCRRAGLVEDEEWLTDDAEMFLPFLETLSWFEEGGLTSFLETRGALLADADRALAESWVGAPIVVGRRDGAEVVLADGRVVAEARELGGFGPAPGSKGFVGRLVELDGEPTVVRCAWGNGDIEGMAEALAAAGDDADAVAEAIGTIR